VVGVEEANEELVVGLAVLELAQVFLFLLGLTIR